MSKSVSPVPVAQNRRDGRRGRFPEAFRREAVRLVTHEQYSFKSAAHAVGVSEKSLRDWHQRYTPTAEPCGPDATVEQLRVENQSLRRQLRQAEMEREILKKATACFASQNP